MDATDQIVCDAVLEVARDHAPDLREVGLNQALVKDLGLDSLGLARLVAVLEMKTGWDPFAEHVAITSIRTVSDLCKAYRREGT
jgi:acyl carrier protein